MTTRKEFERVLAETIGEALNHRRIPILLVLEAGGLHYVSMLRAEEMREALAAALEALDAALDARGEQEEPRAEEMREAFALALEGVDAALDARGEQEEPPR